MAMQQCANGHLYDDSKTPECPYCSGASSIGKTIPLGTGDFGSNAGIGETEFLDNISTVNKREMGVTKAPVENVGSEFKTQFLDEVINSEIKPVRGWLVVVEGAKKGIDYRLHTGKNTVGRSKSNDVAFDFDNTVSAEENVVITYDERNNMFYIQSGKGKNNVYINNSILLDARQIKDNDVIEIGQTKLVLRTFCNETFNY